MGRINPDLPMINLLNQVQSKNFYKEHSQLKLTSYGSSSFGLRGPFNSSWSSVQRNKTTKHLHGIFMISENWFDIDGYMQ